MEPLRTDADPLASAELVAVLALGLATSWRDPHEQVAELRATADATQAGAARAHLAALRAPDPQTQARALELLDTAFPPARPRPRVVPDLADDARDDEPAHRPVVDA